MTGRAIGPEFNEAVWEHQSRLRKRGRPLSAENIPPSGQAALWHEDAIHCVPRSGRDVARQLARLCGDDAKVALPWRSLADAVGKPDKAGRKRAYTERGVEVLVEAGWLRVETVGRKRGAETTFYLMPGDRWIDFWDEVEPVVEAA